MNKIFRILEIVWLVMGCIGAVMCIYNAYIKDTNSAIYFFGFTFICGLMYAFRKRQRIKFENAQNNDLSNKTK